MSFFGFTGAFMTARASEVSLAVRPTGGGPVNAGQAATRRASRLASVGRVRYVGRSWTLRQIELD